MASPPVPAFIRKLAKLGGIDVGGVEMPRLELLQTTSPKLKDLDAHAGEFWHSLANERLGSAVRICPIYIDSRFILWRPRSAGGGILARADDGRHWIPADAEFDVRLDNGREVKWRTARTVKASGLHRKGSSDPSDPKSPPAAERLYEIVCAFAERQDLPPAVLILQRAALKAANKLIDHLKDVRAPSFGVILQMSSSQDKSPSDGPYSYTFEVVGPVVDRTQYEENFAQYRFFIEHGLKVKDLEGAQED